MSRSSPGPSVTVVIPTRNRWRLLRRTLGTVLGQLGAHFEVVIVDDGSSDETSAYLESVTDPRVRVVRKRVSGGVAAARNSGLQLARGEWVAFADDDDLWAPDKLAEQLRATVSNPTASWVVVGEVTVDAKLRVTGVRRPPRDEELPEVLRYNLFPAGGSGTMVRTDLARRLGGFNTELSVLADWDLWIRLFLTAPGARVSRPLVAYVVHPTSMSHDSATVARELEILISAHHAARRRHQIRFLHLVWLQWLVRMEMHRGNRARALGMLPQALRHLHEIPAFISVVAGGVRRRRPTWRWRRESETWLKPLRAGDTLA